MRLFCNIDNISLQAPRVHQGGFIPLYTTSEYTLSYTVTVRSAVLPRVRSYIYELSISIVLKEYEEDSTGSTYRHILWLFIRPILYRCFCYFHNTESNTNIYCAHLMYIMLISSQIRSHQHALLLGYKASTYHSIIQSLTVYITMGLSCKAGIVQRV